MASRLRRLVPDRLIGGEESAAPVPEDLPADPAVGEPLLRIDGLTRHFPARRGLLGNLSVTVDPTGEGPPIDLSRRWVRAVDDVSLTLRRGETLGLVGESGCGKTTLARTALGLLEPTSGRVYYRGRDVTATTASDLRALRADVQIVLQDAGATLDPRMRVGPIVEEPMVAHDMFDPAGRTTRARELLSTVGLDPQHYDRFPHALSGGQRQRVAIARALSVDPDLLVLDEPVAALDPTLQAQVLDMLADLQAEFGLSVLFVAHDLSVIRHVSDRVAVMYLGELAEVAGCEELFENPRHPYTEALLDSMPVPDPRANRDRTVLPGEVPSPVDPPTGCRFHTRCPKLIAPPGMELSDGAWEALRGFIRDVDRKGFDAEDVRGVREERFSDVDLAADAREAVDGAVEAIQVDDWERARSVLRESILAESPCTDPQPAYEIEPAHDDSDERHLAACHLNREDAIDEK